MWIDSVTYNMDWEDKISYNLRPALSCAPPLGSVQLAHSWSYLGSFSIVLLHVIFGYPTCLFPLGCHSITTMQSLFLSIRSTCPFSPFDLITDLIHAYIRSDIVLFLTCCVHHILRIFLRHMYHLESIQPLLYCCKLLFSRLHIHTIVWMLSTPVSFVLRPFFCEIFIIRFKNPSSTSSTSSCPVLTFSLSLCIHSHHFPCIQLQSQSSCNVYQLVTLVLNVLILWWNKDYMYIVSKIKNTPLKLLLMLFPCPSVVLMSSSPLWARTGTLTWCNLL